MPECVNCGQFFNLGIAIKTETNETWIAECPHCKQVYVISKKKLGGMKYGERT